LRSLAAESRNPKTESWVGLLAPNLRDLLPPLGFGVPEYAFASLPVRGPRISGTIDLLAVSRQLA